MKRIIAIFIFLPLVFLHSQDIQITQIDSNGLLFTGALDVYFNLPGFEEGALDVEDLSVSETGVGELKILSLEQGIDEGIDFILILDNSGSMYDETYQGQSRISQAKAALGSFIDEIDLEKNRVGVYAFNTELVELISLGNDSAAVHRSLTALEKPSKEMSYTELYNSLDEVASLFPRNSRRRAVIVLSDGENYPLSTQGGVSHPVWGDVVTPPPGVVRTFHQGGITLDGINISHERDQNLEEICNETGGSFYDVRATSEISGVYRAIRENIAGEYRIKVKAPTLVTQEGRITLTFGDSQDSRTLLIPLLFGGASELPLVISLALLLAGLGGAGLLYVLRFEKPVKSAQIQSLNSKQTLVLDQGTTVIGTSVDADYSMAGTPGVDAEHATIVEDEKTGAFTLVSKRPVRVNNRRVKKRKLTSGDVIQIEGSTIIFDEPTS